MVESAIRLDVLGRFELTVDGMPIVDGEWTRRRAAAILKILALADRHTLHREEVMDILWPDLGGEGAADQLYKNLYWLRRAGRDGGVGEDIVTVAGEIVRLDPSIAVDADRFRREARAALAEPADLVRLTAALEAYGGELLPDDRLEEWTASARDELAMLWRSLAGMRADLLAARGDEAQAIAQLAQIVAREPWDEAAGRKLMELHLAAGRRDAALDQYRSCREALRKELGVEPGPETEAVARRILEGKIDSTPAIDGGAGQRVELLEQLADVRRRTGEVEASAALYGQALQLAGAAPGGEVGGGGSGAETAMRLAGKAALSRILSGDLSGGAELIGQIQRSLTAEMPAYVTARTYLLLSQLRWHSGRFVEALDAAERAVAATSGGPVAERAHALEMLALACHALGDWRRGLNAEMARQALDVGDGFDVDEAFEGHACLWEYHLYGDVPYPGVEAMVRRTLGEAERAGNRRAMALDLLALGSVLYLTGRWADSQEALERAIGLGESVAAEQAIIHGRQRLALLETAAGRNDSALRRLDSAIEAAERSTSAQVHYHSRTRLYATLARNRLQAGAIESAAQAVRSAQAVRAEVGGCPTCDALLYPVSVPVALAVGLHDDATVAVRQAAASGATFNSAAWRAAAVHARGLLALAEDDPRTAVGELDGAARTFARLGQPYDEARSLEALAVALSRDGDGSRDRSVATGRRAAAIYARLGASSDSDRLAMVARQLAPQAKVAPPGNVAQPGKLAGRSAS
jgi:DNA-binding SARP family transcriptional activator/tetratricopeptide (TPR) repeat protein